MLWITIPIGVFISSCTLAFIFIFVRDNILKPISIEDEIERQFYRIHVKEIWHRHSAGENLDLYIRVTPDMKTERFDKTM